MSSNTHILEEINRLAAIARHQGPLNEICVFIGLIFSLFEWVLDPTGNL